MTHDKGKEEEKENKIVCGSVAVCHSVHSLGITKPPVTLLSAEANKVVVRRRMTGAT